MFPNLPPAEKLQAIRPLDISLDSYAAKWRDLAGV